MSCCWGTSGPPAPQGSHTTGLCSGSGAAGHTSRRRTGLAGPLIFLPVNTSSWWTSSLLPYLTMCRGTWTTWPETSRASRSARRSRPRLVPGVLAVNALLLGADAGTLAQLPAWLDQVHRPMGSDAQFLTEVGVGWTRCSQRSWRRALHFCPGSRRQTTCSRTACGRSRQSFTLRAPDGSSRGPRSPARSW